MLELKNISKTIEKNTVLKNINLCFQNRKINVVLGENGAGKTTLLKIIAGLLAPDKKGEVLINGKKYTGDEIELKEKIGYLPSEFFLYDMLTVYEMLKFTASIYKVPVKRIDKLLDFIGLSNFKTHLINSLSHGMKKRLLLLISILNLPSYLILDEPFINLDPFSIVLLKETIFALKNMGICIILATHVLEIAEKVADEIIILSGGKILAQGTLAKLSELSKEPTLESIFLKLSVSKENAYILESLNKERSIHSELSDLFKTEVN